MAFCLQLLSSLSTIIIVIKHKHIGIIMSFCDRKKTIDKFVIKMSKKSHFSQSKFLSLLENLKWISLLWLWEHDVTCPAWSCASGSMNVELIHKCHNWYTLRTGLSQYSKTSDRTEETHIDQPSSAKPSSAQRAHTSPPPPVDVPGESVHLLHALETNPSLPSAFGCLFGWLYTKRHIIQIPSRLSVQPFRHQKRTF